MNGTELYRGRDVADLLNVEFRCNFNYIAKSATFALADISKKAVGMIFNCTKQDIIEALNCSANTAAGPDDIAFLMIKKIASHIVYPLLIIFQQSLAQEIFPLLWKRDMLSPCTKERVTAL